LAVSQKHKKEKGGGLVGAVMGDLETAPEAAAYAAGLLWEEIVLNPNARGRDRKEAFLALTQEADLLGRVFDDTGQEDTVMVPIPRAVVGQIRDYLIAKLTEAAGHQAVEEIDGEIID
jgi:hypothetical protein